ncbi:hypothetical protein ACUNWD_17565 [Sunxiuqinia sp. A32]|uniref:hypothetical protein n=1 Tax=Sunxiuqinia sp. A32 TaxID=3461496 RepID=UPI0040462B20
MLRFVIDPSKASAVISSWISSSNQNLSPSAGDTIWQTGASLMGLDFSYNW